MYRQHLRMVLIQDYAENKPKSEFVHRVASIPVVYLAWNIAAETYNSVKQSNKIFEVSLSTTEKAAFFIARPVVQRFEKQLKSADIIACKGFEVIQNIVPIIFNNHQKLVNKSKDKYEETVESGLRKYEIVKKIGRKKISQLVKQGSDKIAEFQASPYGEVCELTIQLALELSLDIGEMYVDHFLPPLGDERSENFFGDRGRGPSWKRTELLRNRFKERLYKHSLLKIQILRLKTKFLLIQIYHLNMYEFTVKVASSIPGIMFATIIHTFSGLQELAVYLIMLLKSKPKGKLM